MLCMRTNAASARVAPAKVRFVRKSAVSPISTNVWSGQKRSLAVSALSSGVTTTAKQGVDGDYEFEPRGTVEVKGLVELETWFLAGAKASVKST